MSAKKKTVLKGFDYMHCDDFARYLSDMAAKGWHFKEWGVGLKFEKGEAREDVYAVEVFTKASENDMRPEPNTQEFAEYCEAAGWKFMDAKQKFCIFKRLDDNAVELFTPEERVTNSFKGTFSGSALLLCFLYGLNAALQWISLNISLENRIFSGGFFFSFSVWNVMFLGQLLVLLCAFWRKSKLKRDIRCGKEVYIGSRKDGKMHLSWRTLYIGILVLLLMYYFLVMGRIEIVVINAVIVIGTLIFTVLLNKLRPGRDTSVVLQIVFSIMLFLPLSLLVVFTISDNKKEGALQKDNLPVWIADYREAQGGIHNVNYYHEANLLGNSDTYFVFGEAETIRYAVYESQSTVILDKVWEALVSDKMYNEGAVDCTEDWRAKEAIRNQQGTYYVRYDEAIWEFSDDEAVYLSEEQINIILDKLGLR